MKKKKSGALLAPWSSKATQAKQLTPAREKEEKNYIKT